MMSGHVSKFRPIDGQIGIALDFYAKTMPAYAANFVSLSGGLVFQFPAKENCNTQIKEVPKNPVHERSVIRTGQVKHLAGHPTAQRHANHGGHDDGAHQHTHPLRRKIFAHDDGIRRHDTALEQTKHGRDDVQRHHAIEGQEQKQSDALQHRAKHQSSKPTNAIANGTRHQTTHNAARQHQRQHL